MKMYQIAADTSHELSKAYIRLALNELMMKVGDRPFKFYAGHTPPFTVYCAMVYA